MIENACNKNWKPEERASGKAFLSFTLISQSKIRRNIILRFKVIRHNKALLSQPRIRIKKRTV
jgi:hypothetical protein